MEKELLKAKQIFFVFVCVFFVFQKEQIQEREVARTKGQLNGKHPKNTQHDTPQK